MRTFVLTLTLGLGLLLSAVAGEIKFYFESSEGYPGMPVQLVLHAVDERGIDRPDLPEIAGLSFAEAGQSRYEERSLGSGGRSRRVTTEYRWLVTPLQSGRFTIPPVTIEMKEESVTTEALSLVVKEPGPVEGYHLFLTSDSKTVFPGMPVRLTLKWLFSSEVSRPDFTLPFLDREDLRVEDLPAPSSSTSDIFQFEESGHTLYAVQSAEIFEGNQYASISISWDLYPEKAGVLELEPAYLAFQRGVRDSYGRKRFSPAVIPSEALRLTVREIPPELAAFPGGVFIARETLEIEASLDQQRVYPGDPLELTLRMKGLVNPGLSRFRGVDSLGTGLFRTEPGSLRDRVEGKEKILGQTIRMLRPGLSEFPSLEFPYYNMAAGRVETARSGPLPLEVLELESPGPNVLRDQSFLKKEEPEEEGALLLKGNHKIPSRVLPDILYTRRWLFYLLAPILLVLSQLLRFTGLHLRFRERFRGGEFHEFKRAARNLAAGRGDERAALVHLQRTGGRWLDSCRLSPEQDEGEGDLIHAFRKDMGALDRELWMTDDPVDADLKARLIKWPGRLSGRIGKAGERRA